MTIYTKLMEARQTMGDLKKTGTHQQGWKFFEGDKVLEQIGDVLAEHGILFIPVETNAEITTEQESGKNGQVKTVEHAFVCFNMTFVDCETSESLIVPTHGSARDYGDKALYQAKTLAIKYLFLRMFLKGEGDGQDPDAQKVPPARRPATPPRAASKPAAKPQPAPASNGNGGGEGKPHWSTANTPARENFDRAMINSKADEATIKVALGAEDPAISIDRLLLGYDSAGEAISAVLTYLKERATV